MCVAAATLIGQNIPLRSSQPYALASALLHRVEKMQTNEPQRPGVTPIVLVTATTTIYCLWIERSDGPCTKFVLRRDCAGNVFAAIGDEEVCNDYTGD